MIQRICALSFVILIALPFTAPFATFDLRDLAVRGCRADIADAITAPAAAEAQDDTPVWFERSEMHLSMDSVGVNGAAASAAAVFSWSLFVAPAVPAPSQNPSPLAAVLRV